MTRLSGAAKPWPPKSSSPLVLLVLPSPVCKKPTPVRVIAPPHKVGLVRDYALRWGIETLEGIFKTRGFCLESTHFTDPERLRKLFALLTLALVWSLKTGL